MNNQYVLGIFSAHEADENDSKIFMQLNDMKYFNLFLFCSYIFQLICFTGYSFFSYIVILTSFVINFFYYSTLKDDNVNIDLDYSNTNSKLYYLNYADLILIIVNAIDIGLTLYFSFDVIKLNFMLIHSFERKFAFFSCFIIVFRLLCSVILFFWNNCLYIATRNVNCISKIIE